MYNYFYKSNNLTADSTVLIKSFLFLRFLLLYFLINFLIKKDIINLKIFFITSSVAVIFVSLDLFYQFYFGYDIFNNNPYLDKEYLLGNIDEGYLIAPGDEIRIIQVLSNLLTNAIKFSNPNSQITCKVTDLDDKIEVSRREWPNLKQLLQK